MTFTNYILIDASYFIFYRYYALTKWWNLAKTDIVLEIPFENSEFVEKFKKTFKNKLTEIPKKLKIKNYKMFASFDCPRKDIWRTTIFDKYKQNRVTDETFMGSPFFNLGKEIFKELNIDILYNEKLEADDCNALLCKYIISHYTESFIYIIANDMDYLQLASDRIKLINLQYNDLTTNKNWSGIAELDLFCKIVIGDKSDNIPALFKKCNMSTIIQYFHNRELFEQQLQIENAYEKYKMNKILIDFNEIPQPLVLDFITSLNTITF